MVVMIQLIAKFLCKKLMERGMKNLICIIHRIYYYLRHAISKTVEEIQSNHVKICYDNQEFDVRVIDDLGILDTLESGSPINLRWIPGKKRARVWPFVNDKQAQKTVFICDVISIISLLMIVFLIILVFKKHIIDASYALLGFIILMIIMSIIKRKLRVKIDNSVENNKLKSDLLHE